MKYVYLVNRMVKDFSPNVSYPGTLGAFASLKAATKHYDVVVQDRLRRGYYRWWDTGREFTPKKMVVSRFRRTLMQLGLVQEEIIIERWTIHTSKQMGK